MKEWERLNGTFFSHRTGTSQRGSLSPNGDICRKNVGMDISGVASEALLGLQVLISSYFFPLSVSSTIIWKPWWASSRHTENRDSRPAHWRMRSPVNPACSREAASTPAQTPTPLLRDWGPVQGTQWPVCWNSLQRTPLTTFTDAFGFNTLSYMQGQDKITVWSRLSVLIQNFYFWSCHMTRGILVQSHP